LIKVLNLLQVKNFFISTDMFIDVIFLILMVMAVFKGITKGFIIAVFSLLAFIIGLAAALKLSATVADHLRSKMDLSGYWLPVLSFLLVFAVVVLIIRWGAAFFKKAISLAFLGWIDTLLGILLYAFIYLMVYSVILFYATRINLISAEAQLNSKTYSYIEPFGPTVMKGLGKVIPFFSHMFSDLSRFFEGVSKKAS
jgi:membrane protein required for colicin V production